MNSSRVRDLGEVHDLGEGGVRLGVERDPADLVVRAAAHPHPQLGALLLALAVLHHLQPALRDHLTTTSFR